MQSIKIAVSRSISRNTYGSDALLCAELAWRAHPAVPLIDAAFWLIRRERHHCLSCALWEASREREADALDEWRRAGML